MDDALGLSKFCGTCCGRDGSPSHNSVSEITAALRNSSHLHISKDFAPNRSLVFLKFFKTADATEFVEAYNGKLFNSMEVGNLLYLRLSPIVLC